MAISDFDAASNHIESYYQGYEAYLHHPCLNAYKEARQNFNNAIQEQDQWNAFVAGIVVGVASAGIAGCLGAFIEGAVTSQFTKVSSIVWAGNEAAQASATKIMSAGAIDLIKQVSVSATSSPVTLLAKSVGMDLATESPTDFEKEDKMWSRVKTEHKKALDVIFALSRDDKKAAAGLKAFPNKAAKKGIGPLESVAVAMTGNRQAFDMDDAAKQKRSDLMAKRFEIGLWWTWLCKMGPEKNSTHKDKFDRMNPYDKTPEHYYTDQSFGEYSWLTGSLGRKIQDRIKQLTASTVPLLNSGLIPHFDALSGNLVPNQSVANVINKFAPVK